MPTRAAFRGFSLLQVIALVGASALLVAAPDAQSQREVRERHIAAAVTDKNDAAIAGLTAADFVVREDGLAREIIRVTPAAPPTHVAILVDDGHYPALAQITNDLRDGLVTLLHKLQAGNPEIALYTLADRPTQIVNFSRTYTELEKQIKTLFPRTGSGIYMINGVIDACREFQKREAARPVIVAFIDEDSPEFSEELHTRGALALKNTHASLWTLTLQARISDLPSEGNRERLLLVNDDARDNGGMNTTVLSKMGLEAAFGRVADVITSRYDIVYARPETMIPPTKVEVTTRKAGATVRATRWAGQ